MIERQRFSPWAQLALLLVLVGGGIILSEFISVFIVQACLPHTTPHVKLQESVLKNVDLTRTLQIIGTFFWFIIPSFIFTHLNNGSLTVRHLGFTSVISGKQMFLVVILFFAAFFVSDALDVVNQNIPLTKGMAATFKGWEDDYKTQTEALGTIRSGGEYVVALVILALLPAIAEETLFRGCLQKVIIKITRSSLTGIIITSIIFSLVHGSYYGFLVRLFLGCMLGYIYYYSKNIWLNIAAHFLNNAVVVTAMYSIAMHGATATNTADAEKVPTTSILAMGAAATVAMFYLFKMFKQESEFVISMHRLNEGLFKDDDVNNVL